MLQLIQSLGSGEVALVEVPEPVAAPGRVVIATTHSVISAGTERAGLELAGRSLAGKALERPDQVRQVLEKARTEGVRRTVELVRTRLSEPVPMGYSSVGTVLACGEGVTGIRPGDRVASNGPHAEVVSVPRNLCAPVPAGVPGEEAAFAVLGAVALNGVRLARVELGGTALVVGLGLIGQLAVGLLRAAGVRVFGTDPDAERCRLALRMGASAAAPELGAAAVEEATGGAGADAVIIAAATRSNAPVETAVAAVRKKGRIVLVGVSGLELDRRPFYFKECEFVVSCSYGPGRYDPLHEERGIDYPLPYVRWTEGRNIRAVLELMADGALDVRPLISHRFPFERAVDAYRMIERGEEPYLGVVFEYRAGAEGAAERAEGPREASRAVPRRTPAERTVEPAGGGAVGLGVVGAGSFARSVLLPAARDTGRFALRSIASASGLSAADAARRFAFAAVARDVDEVLADEEVRAVAILTRHREHAALVVRALEAGRHVFVEKPLALSAAELEAVEAAVEAAPGRLLMVGFNRRFSPAARAVRAFFRDAGAPLTVSIRMNAGPLDPGHWTQDPAEGGRIVGEACHAIDLAAYLTGSPPVRVFAESIGGDRAPAVTEDQTFITLRHADGSVSSVAYLAGGDRAFPKERVEVFGAGRVAVIDDFRRAEGVRGGRRRRLWAGGRDKGHRAELEAFARAIREGGPWPIPWETLRAVTLAALGAVESLRTGRPVEIR